MNRSAISCILITIPFSTVLVILLHTICIYAFGHHFNNIYPIVALGIICYIITLSIMVLILKALKLYEKQTIPIIVISILIPHLAAWYYYTVHVIPHHYA